MSRAIKKIPYKFVHVYWIDITSDSSWQSIEDVKESKLPRCLSTGFLVSKDDDDIVRIVSDFNFKEDLIIINPIATNVPGATNIIVEKHYNIYYTQRNGVQDGDVFLGSPLGAY